MEKLDSYPRGKLGGEGDLEIGIPEFEELRPPSGEEKEVAFKKWLSSPLMEDFTESPGTSRKSKRWSNTATHPLPSRKRRTFHLTEVKVNVHYAYT